MGIIQDNGLILIIYKDKKYLKRITYGQSFHGKGGALNYSDIIGEEHGIRFGEYDIYEPTIEDIIMYAFKRETQIIYPKDSFYITFKINAKNASRVLEVGTGSGTLTYVLAHAVGPQGKVVTFELEERHYRNARKNIEKYGEWNNVELHNADATGYFEGGFDAAFIDVREPWTCLDKVRSLMKESASVGMIVPTANQISELLKALENGFGHVEVMEIMHRKYKTVAERVRPQDRMIAHTGYLVFARKIEVKT
jgi:tRNA (adenine57-N1/adenine58-N1)-methyltransferase catalytic subunit